MAPRFVCTSCGDLRVKFKSQCPGCGLYSTLILITQARSRGIALPIGMRGGARKRQEYLTTGIAGLDAMMVAARDLLETGAKAVLLKGGHGEGSVVTDILVSQGEAFVFDSARIETRHTHGTGCTLASAIATGLAQGMSLKPAVERARSYVLEAIRTAPGFGAGHGPLNHGHGRVS